jgi:hypothetical protein
MYYTKDTKGTTLGILEAKYYINNLGRRMETKLNTIVF